MPYVRADLAATVPRAYRRSFNRRGKRWASSMAAALQAADRGVEGRSTPTIPTPCSSTAPASAGASSTGSSSWVAHWRQGRSHGRQRCQGALCQQALGNVGLPEGLVQGGMPARRSSNCVSAGFQLISRSRLATVRLYDQQSAPRSVEYFFCAMAPNRQRRHGYRNHKHGSQWSDNQLERGCGQCVWLDGIRTTRPVFGADLP